MLAQVVMERPSSVQPATTVLVVQGSPPSTAHRRVPTLMLVPSTIHCVRLVNTNNPRGRTLVMCVSKAFTVTAQGLLPPLFVQPAITVN